MKELILEKGGGHALILIAHPDDETIWLGGTILRHSEIHWTIFSLCREYDPDRFPKFLKVCKLYQAKAIISDLEDEDILTVKKSIPEIKERLNKLLKGKKFDYLFTHGAKGEYGHFRHLGVHQATEQLIKEKKIKPENVFYFCYQGKNCGDGSKLSNDFKKAKYILKLTPAELKQKRKIVNKMYGYGKKSFEYLSCLGEETFS